MTMSTRVHGPSGLEKSVWTDRDLEQLGFHDARVVAVAVTEGNQPGRSRLIMDLDYLVRWIYPVAPAQNFSFWIAPATLVFDDVWSLSGELQHADLAIDGIGQLDPQSGPGWRIDGHTFELRVITYTGFTLYMRRPPIFADHQCLTLEQRGGISFEEAGFDHGDE